MRRTVATLLAAVVLLSTLGTGAFAASNGAFDGGQIDASDETGTYYIGLDTDVQNNTVAMTEAQSLTSGESVTYTTSVPAASAEIVDADTPSNADVTVLDNGNVEVSATGSVSINELHVTFDSSQYPYALTSEDAEKYADASQTSVSIANQSGNGEIVNVQAEHTEGFFVVLHETDENGDPITDENVGVSAPLDAGDYRSINVELDGAYDNDTELVAMVHANDDGNVGQSLAQDTGTISPNEIVFSTGAESLIQDPDQSETMDYRVLEPTEFVNTEVSIENGEISDGVFEADDKTAGSTVTVDYTRNNTPYQGFALDSMNVEFWLDTGAFENIEDNTTTDNASFVLDSLSESDGYEKYDYQIVDPSSTETYTVTVDAEQTLDDADNAVVSAVVIDPAGGPAMDGSVLSADTETPGIAPNFPNVGGFGLDELIVGGLVVVGLVVGLMYARNGSGLQGFMAFESQGMNLLWGSGIVFGAVLIIENFTSLDFFTQLFVDFGVSPETPLIAGAGLIAFLMIVNVYEAGRSNVGM